MTFGQLLHRFAEDDQLAWALILVALDLVLGVIAAVKLGTFRLSYVSDVLRNDILFKLVPWFVLYAAAIVGPQGSFVIPGLDLGFAAGTAFTLAAAAWVGSILSSLANLGLGGAKARQTTALFGAENAAPPHD